MTNETNNTEVVAGIALRSTAGQRYVFTIIHSQVNNGYVGDAFLDIDTENKTHLITVDGEAIGLPFHISNMIEYLCRPYGLKRIPITIEDKTIVINAKQVVADAKAAINAGTVKKEAPVVEEVQEEVSEIESLSHVLVSARGNRYTYQLMDPAILPGGMDYFREKPTLFLGAKEITDPADEAELYLTDGSLYGRSYGDIPQVVEMLHVLSDKEVQVDISVDENRETNVVIITYTVGFVEEAPVEESETENTEVSERGNVEGVITVDEVAYENQSATQSPNLEDLEGDNSTVPVMSRHRSEDGTPVSEEILEGFKLQDDPSTLITAITEDGGVKPEELVVVEAPMSVEQSQLTTEVKGELSPFHNPTLGELLNDVKVDGVYLADMTLDYLLMKCMRSGLDVTYDEQVVSYTGTTMDIDTGATYAPSELTETHVDRDFASLGLESLGLEGTEIDQDGFELTALNPVVDVKVLDPRLLDFGLPSYATPGSAGLDLRAMFEGDELTIYPGETHIVGTGIAIYLENTMTVGKVYPRSGLSSKHGIALANTVGIVDSDYQGELKLMLKNYSSDTYTIKLGDRVAQMVVSIIDQVDLRVVSSFDATTERGEGRLNSTGSN